MKNSLFATVFLFLANLSFADSWSSPEFFTIQEVRWNVSQASLEVITRKVGGGENSNYKYKYVWSSSGNSVEQAKILLSVALTAHAAGRRVDIFGDHGLPSTTIFNNFTGISLLD